MQATVVRVPRHVEMPIGPLHQGRSDPRDRLAGFAARAAARRIIQDIEAISISGSHADELDQVLALRCSSL